MKNRFFLLITLMFAIFSCTMNKEEDLFDVLPSLEEVSGVWVSADTADMEPSIRNFRGQALLNRDMTSLSWFASAPYSGGYHTGVLRIGGQAPKASMFRWFPHQAIRKGELDKWQLVSTVKMIPDQDVVMWEVHIVNDASEPRELDLSLDLIGFISKYGGDWQWWYPYPKLDGSTTVRDDEVENVRKHIGSLQNYSDETVVEPIDGKPTPTDKKAHWPSDAEILSAGTFSSEMKGEVLLVSDRESEARTAFVLQEKPDQLELQNSGGTARWKRTLNPGESFTISYLMGYQDQEEKLLSQVDRWSSDFDTIFSRVDGIWEERWESLFNPGDWFE